MKPPYLRLFSEEEIWNVFHTSLKILEQTGMVVDHEVARQMLEAAGAVVDHDNKLVKFPPDLVKAKLKLVPKEMPYHGLTPDFDAVLEVDGEIYSRVAGGTTGYIDLGTGKYRRALKKDWEEFVTISDALPSICSIATMHVGDVPGKTADLHSFHVLLTKQRKCVVHNAFNLRNMDYLIEMAIAVAGSKELLKERPFYHHMLSPISPLFLNEDDTAQLLLACEYGIPTDMPIMPTTGTTGPITLAGLLALANAEFLGTMTLAQIARPGHIMPFFLDPVVADLKSGSTLFAAPEVGLLCAGISQLGYDVYQLPSEGIGLASDGFTVEQALFQKAQNTIFQVMAGGKLVIGAGFVESDMALSPTQLVIDDEIMNIAKRWLKGIRVDKDTLASEVIHKVGPRSHFLSEYHTIKYMRAGELMSTKIFERDRRDIWEMKGSKTQEQKAREIGLSILENHHVPSLPTHVEKELSNILAIADKELTNS